MEKRGTLYIRNQTTCSVQSDLDLHCPQKLLVSSSVSKELSLVLIRKDSSLARVFLEKTRSIAMELALCRHHARTVTFCNISAITEDVYLKLGACIHYPKSNPYYQGRQFKMLFFFQNYAPFFDVDFLSSIKHSTAEHWHPHVVLLF